MKYGLVFCWNDNEIINKKGDSGFHGYSRRTIQVLKKKQLLAHARLWMQEVNPYSLDIIILTVFIAINIEKSMNENIFTMQEISGEVPQDFVQGLAFHTILRAKF